MWHLYPIKVPQASRRRVFEKLREDGFGVQVNYIPANHHPVFTENGYKIDSTPVSNLFYSEEISLPMMANKDVLNSDFFERIRNSLKSALIGKD
jgi:dTDP-4-amino-4,6-dideoxygalactose transaminase